MRSAGIWRIASGEGACGTLGLPWHVMQCWRKVAMPVSVPCERLAPAAAAGAAVGGGACGACADAWAPAVHAQKRQAAIPAAVNATARADRFIGIPFLDARNVANAS